MSRPASWWVCGLPALASLQLPTSHKAPVLQVAGANGEGCKPRLGAGVHAVQPDVRGLLAARGCWSTTKALQQGGQAVAAGRLGGGGGEAQRGCRRRCRSPCPSPPLSSFLMCRHPNGEWVEDRLPWQCVRCLWHWLAAHASQASCTARGPSPGSLPTRTPAGFPNDKTGTAFTATLHIFW